MANQISRFKPSDILSVRDLALVNEPEAGDTDFTVHEEVSSALDKELGEIVKETEV
jgi:hypothetical protein